MMMTDQAALDDLGRALDTLRQLLYGTGDQEPKKQDVQDIAAQAHKRGLLLLLVRNLAHLEFESRKHATQIFNNLIKMQATTAGGKSATVDYICDHLEVLFTLLHGYVVTIICGDESIKVATMRQ